LRHYSNVRKLFMNVNIFKKRNIEAMIFHVKNDSDEEIIFRRCDIKSIMFLSKIFISTETRYWFTELKMTEVIWIIRKVRHLIKTSKKQSAIVFTNHSVLINIIKQTFLITFNINKLNLRLVKVSQYFSALSIDIKIKFEKFHVISNALFRLFSIMNKNKSKDDEDVLEDLQYDLDVLLVQFINEIHISSYDTKSSRIHDYLDICFEQDEILIEMTENYRKNLLEAYRIDIQWVKMKQKLKIKENSKDIFDDMNFFLRDDLIYYSSEEKTFKLCISWSLKKNIYEMTHDNNHHCEFHRVYTRLSESVYIRHMIKRLRRYIHHCKFCLKKQTKRHSLYDELNSIRTMTLSFHTMIIDFIVVLSSSKEYDAMLTTIDKFFKRISLISEKETWKTSEWASVWLNVLQKEEWKLLKIIIFDRDSKFVEFFWKITFQHFDVVLHFTTAYHLSFDDQSKRINQTIKIIIRFALMKDQVKNFTKLISFIQSFLNNASNAFIELSLNEILYEFKVRKSLNLLARSNDENLTTAIKNERDILKKKAEETIVFVNASMKIRHDSTRKSLNLNVEDFVYLKLHKEYKQSDLINRKFVKQRLESVKILEKINKLAYKLKIFFTWKIHFVISIAHLEFASSENDFYERESRNSNFVENAQENTKNIYEIEKILIKRSIKIERARHLKIQYRVKWTDWDDQHNQWVNATDMRNVKNLMNEFETKLFERNLSSQ
jgi:hypothetical protein